MRSTASTEGSFQNQEPLKISRISKLREGTKKKVFGDPESSSEAGTQGPSSGVGGVGGRRGAHVGGGARSRLPRCQFGRGGAKVGPSRQVQLSAVSQIPPPPAVRPHVRPGHSSSAPSPASVPSDLPLNSCCRPVPEAIPDDFG